MYDTINNMIFPDTLDQGALTCNTFPFESGSFGEMDGGGVIWHNVCGNPMQIHFIKGNLDTFIKGFRCITMMPAQRIKFITNFTALIDVTHDVTKTDRTNDMVRVCFFIYPKSHSGLFDTHMKLMV